MRNVAVILAGGVGRRAGGEIPKQFLMLEGRMVIEHSIDTFDKHKAIDEVCIVTHPDWIEQTKELVTRRGWAKVKKIVAGGAERYLSTLNAVMAYIDEPDDTDLLLHDAARPWVTTEIIDRVTEALKHHEAVGVAIPSTDTMWEVHPDMNGDWATMNGKCEIPRFIARIPERRLMWRAQTPQAFRLPLIRDAYQRALQDPQFQATDDCSVVRNYMPGVKIAVVEGDEGNKKITYPHDLESRNQ